MDLDLHIDESSAIFGIQTNGRVWIGETPDGVDFDMDNLYFRITGNGTIGEGDDENDAYVCPNPPCTA